MNRPTDEDSGPLPNCESCGLPELDHDSNGKIVDMDDGRTVCFGYVSEGYDEDEPEVDDTVHECSNCERPQQFPGLCASCTTEMKGTPESPFWETVVI